jgi:hypothetical protein
MMGKNISIMWCLMMISGFIFGQTTKVLFIGNSYTGVNNLPQLTYDMALSAGDTLLIDSHTPGGQRLLNHASNVTANNKIKSNQWNYVVLQAQSQEPSWPIGQVQSDVYPYAKTLCDTIRANDSCSVPVFYMTWGRKNGDAFNCPNWPPVCTYDGMDSLLSERYQAMANDNDALVSPVGAVWHYIRDNFPQIELYSADESHPSLAGSYAAGCAFYAVFMRKNPELISYHSTLDPGMADAIQTAAKTVVYDSLSKWNVGKFDPIADFTSVDTTFSPMVQFTSQSQNADSYHWDFGDGNTSSLENPTHGYATGVYQVTLIVTKCGRSDTLIKTINAIIGGVDEIGIDQLNVYPNPVNDVLRIEGELQSTFIQMIIINDVGEVVQTNTFRNTWDVSSIPNGIYLLKLIQKDGNEITRKIIVK